MGRFQPLQPPGPSAPPAAAGASSRILILFDIHGVMGCKIPSAQPGYRADHAVRPHIEHILRLLPQFSVGVYSSATQPTVRRAMTAVKQQLAAAVKQRGVAAHVPEPLFTTIFHRQHCRWAIIHF